MQKIKVHGGGIAMTLLKAVGVAGMAVALLAMPGLGIVAKELMKARSKEERNRLYQSLQYLKRRGYVTIEYLKEGELKIFLTKQGRTVIKQLHIEELQIPIPPIWDKIWRVVIFDVPNWKNKNRLAFTENLKRIGFRMIQKSVWVFPYPCHHEIMILRKFYNIEKEVTFLETTMVEDEEIWNKHFSHLKLH